MKPKAIWVVLCCGFLTLFAVSCGKKAPEQTAKVSKQTLTESEKHTVLAKVGDTVITLGDFEAELQALPEFTRSRLTTKDAKKKQLDKMIDELLLMKEAEARGLDKDPDIQKKLESYRKRMITEKLYQAVAQAESPVSEEEIKKYFEEHKDQFEEKEKIRVSQIMIMVPPNADPEKEKEAKVKIEQALKRAKKGEDFSKLAQEYSEGGPTAGKGGDLGYITKGRMMPEFETAAFSLKNVGDISDIVKTQFGYHIIKLTDRKPAHTQSLEEARDRIVRQIEAQRRRDARQNLPQELRKKVAIEIHDELLKDEPGASPEAATPAPPPAVEPGGMPSPAAQGAQGGPGSGQSLPLLPPSQNAPAAGQ